MLILHFLGQLRDGVTGDEQGGGIPANVDKPNGRQPKNPKPDKAKKEKTPRQSLEAVT